MYKGKFTLSAVITTSNDKKNLYTYRYRETQTKMYDIINFLLDPFNFRRNYYGGLRYNNKNAALKRELGLNILLGVLL